MFTNCDSTTLQHNQHLAAGLVEGRIAVFQYTAGKHQLASSPVKIEEHYKRQDYVCIKFSPDSMHLALGSSCGFIDVFDVVRGYVWVGGTHISNKAVNSIDWSYDCKTLQTSTAEHKISYWDVSRRDVQIFPAKGRDANRDNLWGTWTSPVGWAVNGIAWDSSKIGAVRRVDVVSSPAGSFDIRLVHGEADGVPSLLLATTAHQLHLLNFPVLPDAKACSLDHPSSQAAAACFSRDGSRVYSVSGDGLCIFQWRVLSPSELGLSGQRTRAKRAADKKFTLLDREKFWKITRKEMEELRRRGVRSDIIRVVEPQSQELQEARLQVIDFTFEQVDLMRETARERERKREKEKERKKERKKERE